MRTLKYIGRRLLVLVPQLFLISIITFTLVRMLPGDPARLELGPLAPEEGVELLRHQLRLDRLRQVLGQFELGCSRSSRPRASDA